MTNYNQESGDSGAALMLAGLTGLFGGAIGHAKGVESATAETWRAATAYFQPRIAQLTKLWRGEQDRRIKAESANGRLRAENAELQQELALMRVERSIDKLTNVKFPGEKKRSAIN